MDEGQAVRVVEALRARSVFAHVKPPQAGRTPAGVRVVLPDGREAVWDNDGTAGLEAQVMRDGVLVGFVPRIDGSEEFTDAQIVEAIAAADYDRPVTRSPRPERSGRAPGTAALPPYAPSAGILRRLRDTFRG
jgi:hypothetical protein